MISIHYLLAPPSLQQEPFVTQDTIVSSVLAVAETAKAIWRKKGGGNKAVINQVACGALAREDFSAVSEGGTEGQVWLRPGAVLASDRRACMISDALESAGQFGLSRNRSRACTVLLSLAPKASVPKVSSAQRVRYLPKSWVVGAWAMRPTRLLISSTGVTVERIMAGDFQSFVESAAPVKPDGPIRISAGEGGLTEAICEIPHLKWSRGIMLTQIVPHTKEVDGLIFTKETTIRSDDRLLAVAGLTEADARASLATIGYDVAQLNLGCAQCEPDCARCTLDRARQYLQSWLIYPQYSSAQSPLDELVLAPPAPVLRVGSLLETSLLLWIPNSPCHYMNRSANTGRSLRVSCVDTRHAYSARQARQRTWCRMSACWSSDEDSRISRRTTCATSRSRHCGGARSTGSVPRNEGPSCLSFFPKASLALSRLRRRGQSFNRPQGPKSRHLSRGCLPASGWSSAESCQDRPQNKSQRRCR